MKFIQHPTANMILCAPQGMADCDNLPATMMVDEKGEGTIATFWEPSPEELAALNKGGKVVLYVFGGLHPPVALGVDTNS